MFASPYSFAAPVAHVVAAGHEASAALVTMDLAAAGWLVVGLVATAIVVLARCRDRRPSGARQRSRTAWPWTGALAFGRAYRRFAQN